jgi:hypothetical protein
VHGYFSSNKILMEHRTEANTNSTLGRLTVPKWEKVRSVVKMKRESKWHSLAIIFPNKKQRCAQIGLQVL